MLEFPKSVQPGDDETSYRRWLSDHPNGFVVGENINRRGKRSWHSASCDKVTFHVGERLRQRSGRVCLDDRTELNEWCAQRNNLALADLNECPYCRPSGRT